MRDMPNTKAALTVFGLMLLVGSTVYEVWILLEGLLLGNACVERVRDTCLQLQTALLAIANRPALYMCA